jgi:cytochrome c
MCNRPVCRFIAAARRAVLGMQRRAEASERRKRMKFLMVAAGVLALGGVAQAQDFDLAAGEKVFKKCMACHAIGPDAKNKVGPQLNGLVGREVAKVEGFKYSEGDGSMTAWGAGKKWDVATLKAYLPKPKDLVPKTKMAFAGLKDEAEINNLIAYVAQFDAAGATVDPKAVLDANKGM